MSTADVRDPWVPSPSGGGSALLTGRPEGYEGNGNRPSRDPTSTPPVRVIPRPVNAYRRALRNCPDVTGSNLSVALLMAERADYESGMNSHPSQAALAAEIGWTTTRQVRSVQQWLVATGWLHDTGARAEGDSPHGGPKVYWLTIPECGHPHDGSALPRIRE